MSIMNLPGHFATRRDGDPPWEIATLFPSQGAWTVDEYLELTDSTNRLIEFTEGHIEVLEMPTMGHQLILAYLYDALKQFVSARQLGIVLFAAFRIRLTSTIFREPDIMFMRHKRRDQIEERYWTGADLVMEVEVVSDDHKSRERDFVKKRKDYAAAGISEYWIVDPLQQRIFVLKLEGDEYVEIGAFAAGQQAVSRLLEGFAVDVTAVFDAARV